MTQDISEDRHFQMLRVLEQSPNVSQRDIAKRLKISLGGVNYCLTALIEKGQVKVRNFRASDNRLRYAYILTPQGIAAKSRLTGRFLKRKLAEYDDLRAEIEVLKAEMQQPISHQKNA